MILSAGKIELIKHSTSIGIGLIQSAMNLTKICIEQKPKFLLFLATAGSYGNKKIHEIYKSNMAKNIELSYLKNQSYSPISLFIDSIFPDVPYGTFENCIVNSSNFITNSYKSSKLFLHHDCDIENMEFFSVLQVANAFNIPAFGIFYITNYCNENARNSFVCNHEIAKLKLNEIANFYKDFK